MMHSAVVASAMVAIGFAVSSQVGKSRYRFGRHLEEKWVQLNSNAFVADRDRSCNRRTTAHEWIKNHSRAEREGCPDNLPHERLRLQGRMRADRALVRPGRGRRDHVRKGSVMRDAA